MSNQTLEPSQLVIKFWAWLRIAVREIKAGDPDALHRCFQIATVGIVWIVRQPAAVLDRLAATSQDRDAIPGLLPMPDGPVTRCAESDRWKSVVRRFELLQANDIRRLPFQPFEQVAQARADPIDIERGDF